MRPTTDKGFTLIELLVAMAILVVIGLLLLELLKSGILASDRGSVSAQTRENARVGLDRLQTELRQATPVPTGSVEALPPVIFPAPGGQFSGQFSGEEASSVGCGLVGINSTGGCVVGGASPLNPAVRVPPPFVVQAPTGPSGFVIFSEYIPVAAGANSSGALDPANYRWVMYQVNPASVGTHAQLVRYTFPVSGGPCAGVIQRPGGWTRNSNCFIPENSNEKGNPLPVISLSNPADQLWAMVNHGPAPFSVNRKTGAIFDPQVFTVTVIVTQIALTNRQSPGLPPLMVTLSSEVKVEGGGE